jgi:hypothetical protein
MEDFHLSLPVGCSSSGRHLPHVDDVEAYVLKAVGNIFPLACLGEGDGLKPLYAFLFLQRMLHALLISPSFLT